MIEQLKNIISKSAIPISGSVARFYYYYVPQNTALPYVTYYLITETYLGRDTKDLFGDVKLQFNIYSKYSDYGTQCNTILNEVQNYFDNNFKSFAITSGSVNVISCTRDFTRPASFNNEVWQAVTQYNLHILN